MSMIRALRERNGISAEMLARRMGVTLDIVEGWERAESSPNERQVGSLARILGTSKSAITDPRMISKDATIEPESAVD
ncbi:MAG TPA: helix-turn-helix transcriptional regulator [Thermomicrobiaceae bacterium]|nr:helix-turn-helix transcriptional regulator [Thermomicrobiaceae bacterium]